MTAVDNAMSKYLRDAWYLAGWSSDFDDAGLNPVMVLGEPIVLYRREQGGWVGLADVCCHRLVPLSLGRREGDALRCMYHGLKFDCEGRCIEIPGRDRISSAIRVQGYPVAERYGGVWVWMGLPELADESEIPALIPGDPEAFVVDTNSVELATDAELIWDNLLDLTHIPFAHANSFGGGDQALQAAMIAAETAGLEILTIDRGIRTERWHLNRPTYAFLKERLSDDFVTGDFVAPGVLINTSLGFPVGTGDTGKRPGPESKVFSHRISTQVVTPIAEGRSKIFYSTGMLAEHREGVPHMMALLAQVLSEDKLFIEAQQRRMEQLPNAKPMNLAMDASATRFKAVMKRLHEGAHSRREALSH